MRSRLLWGAMLSLLCLTAGGLRAQEAEAYTERLPKNMGRLQMVPIPAGQVTLDDPANPGTAVVVDVPALYMSKTEVRWDEFSSYMYRFDLTDAQAAAGFDSENRPSMPYVPPDRGFGTDGFPVISVSYQNAVKFCEWLSKLTGKTYRLPTEAEWVWAALGGELGTDAASCEPLTAEQLGAVAWYGRTMANPNNGGQPGTMPVGKQEANGYGLFDMFGNVREWVTGLDDVPVTKGGGWVDEADALQPYARIYQDDSWRLTDPQDPKSQWWLADGPFVGFRVVCEEGPAAEAGG